FDLTVYLVERDGRFALDAVYDADLYDPERADALLAGCAGLVGALAAAPDAPAGAAGLVAADRLRAGLVDDRPPAPPRRPDPLDAPATPTEHAVAEVWREVLGTPAFGAGDNFFEVGGSSLAIVAVQVRLSERLGRQLRLVDLFRFPNVRGLAAHLDGARDDQMLERAARRVAVRRERLRQRPVRRAGAAEEGGE
ncbi:MAG TPA: phosphopantetheine-binding protein, partial [Candidatus Dormibacteraeota bacterium]